MKKRALVIAALVSFFLLSSFTSKTLEDWRTYTYRSGNFKVSLPGAPETRKERVMTIKSKAAGIYYMVSFNQVEKDSKNTRQDIEFALREGAEEYKRSLNASVENERTITLNGLPAKELKMKTSSGIYMVYRIAISQDRIYQLNVMSALDYPEEQKTQQFFDSFELLSR